MKKQYHQSYLDLIEQLLQYVGQEGRFRQATQLLAANGKWANTELLQAMVQAADQLQEQDKQQKAEWLQDLAHSLASSLGLETSQIPASLIDVKTAYDFLEKFGDIVMDNQGNRAIALFFLALKQKHLNLTLLSIIPRAASLYFEKFANEEDVAAAYFFEFGNCFNQFQLGDRQLNLELSITSYHQALRVYTYEKVPKAWARIQVHLALSYLEHVGDKQAEYIELAITAINKALRVRTFEARPEDWADCHGTLTQAYQKRIYGDKAENIETAIALCQKVVQAPCSTFPEKWVSAQGMLADLYQKRLQGDLADNIDLAIAACREALSVWTYEQFPSQWAATQSLLGKLYTQRIRGDQSDNIEIVIASCQKALQVFTREAFPEQWAMTQCMLAYVYKERIYGDKDVNIETLIAICQQIIEVYTKETFPEKWAVIHFWLASVYKEHTGENKANNIEQEIASYHQVLQVYTREKSPEMWAKVQCSLASAYVNRINGDRSENIKLAIASYQEILQVHTREACSEKWAAFQMLLATAYSELIQSNEAEYSELAIAAYQKALEVYTREAFPEEWADTQSALASIYRRVDKAQNTELALDIYQQVLQVYTREIFPEKWATIQHNLANIYKDREHGNEAKNIEASITACKQALQIRTRKEFPEKWAVTLSLLAEIYMIRIQGNKAENLEMAIDYYQEVLEIYTHKEFPEKWAETQRHLAYTHVVRIRGNAEENIEIAIDACQKAFQVYTRKAFPKQWATIKQCLATTYLTRIRGNKEDNIEAVIDALQEVLEVITYSVFPNKWATTQVCLASAYKHRICGDKSENIEQAISLYEQVLETYTPNTPLKLAIQTHCLLADVYKDRIYGDKANNIEQAINYYQQALDIPTQGKVVADAIQTQCYLADTYLVRPYGDKSENIEQAISIYQQAIKADIQKTLPAEWAITHSHLANAYQIRIQGDPVKNIEQAINCYKLALKITPSEEYLKKCWSIGIGLAQLASPLQKWELVIQGYEAAISCIEQIRSWQTDEVSRQKLQVDAIPFYDDMVQACINTGQFEKALETVERSRSKRLVELMATKDLYYKGQMPSEIETYLQQYDDLQNQINQHHRKESEVDKLILIDHITGTTRNRAALEASSEEIKALEHQKQKIHQQLSRLDPVTAGLLQVSAPNIAAMKQLIDHPTTALLSFYSTDTSSYIFVLRHDQVTCHLCSEQTVKTLQIWIVEQWLSPYLTINQTTDATEKRQKQKDWASQITPFLAELGQRLQLDTLIKTHLQGIEELILVPHLYLHQIPFAAIPTQEGLLGDQFRLRIIPSCQILEFCHNRPPINSDDAFGMVEDTTEDLPCAAFEGERIAQLYDIPDHNRLRGRQQATIANYRHLIEQVQTFISCQHAQFRLDEPLESRLILADGTITLGQLLTPAWRLPQLSDVFLSCCETGLGFAQNRTDDIVTLATGFLCAGARSVVSTLWAVDDLATALFSIFYHQHRRTLDRPTALQQAQQDLRQITGTELKQHYKQPLLTLLDQKFEDAEALRQKAAQQMSQLASASTEYVNAKQEHDLWAKTATRADDTSDRLKDLCKEPFPFQNPIYWSAFICQGLR